MTDAYKDDLAFIHDASFGGLARSAASMLQDELRRQGVRDGLVIDLGCGSGILSQELVASGYDVLGIDISKAMVALARARVPQGQFRTESLLSAELSPCVAVAAIGECFNYLFDDNNTIPNLSRVFQRIYEALNHQGVFIFDVAGSAIRGTGYRTFTEGEGWAVLMTAEENHQSKLLTRTPHNLS